MMEVGRDLSMKAPKCYELLIQTIKTQSKSKNPTQKPFSSSIKNKLHQMNKILVNHPNKHQMNNQDSQSCRSSKNKAKHSKIAGITSLSIETAARDIRRRTITGLKSPLLLLHCASPSPINPFNRPFSLARRIHQLKKPIRAPHEPF